MQLLHFMPVLILPPQTRQMFLLDMISILEKHLGQISYPIFPQLQQKGG